MSESQLPKDLRALAQRHGIALSYKDMAGVERHTGIETALALLRADGVEIDDAHRAAQVLAHERATQCDLPSVLVVEGLKPSAHQLGRGTGDWHLAFDADTSPIGATPSYGTAKDGVVTLPPLPHGVHHLMLDHQGIGQHIIVIAAPLSAPILPNKLWGVTGALYGLGHESGLLGTYTDLGDWGAALGEQGAAFFGINPIHALGFFEEEINSPYSPSHRGFLNTNHLTVERHSAPTKGGGLLDYTTQLPPQKQALRQAFTTFEETAPAAAQAAFAAFAQDDDLDVRAFAQFECLSRHFGSDSRLWPADVWSHPVEDREIRFHIWMQWVAGQQLKQAQERAQAGGLSHGLYLDLAVGARRGGAEDFLGRHVMASNVSLGAPGDHLAPAGQDWNLCGFSPAKLVADDYGAFRQILRANFRHAGIVRIDHVLGLARSFWIPDDGSPGGYIAHNFEAMLAVVVLEAARAGTVVVGEDLGLVPEGFRAATAKRGLYGYSVLQYERGQDGTLCDGQTLRPQSLACFSTHDTPTVEGFRVGRDMDWWEKLGWVSGEDARTARSKRTDDVARLANPQNTQAAGFRKAVHEKLARSPAQLVAVQLDDLLGHEEAQNLPGTIDEHPNWRRCYALQPNGLTGHPTIQETAELMEKAGRSRR
ncbi:MAG: 4-alpha-glucanotransferase [Pseudomonadota bacterium]